VRWLPNCLTLLRLTLTPFAVWAIVAGEHRRAFALFVAAALTDGLDGYLARRFGWQTRAGAYLDPIADKSLLTATYLALGYAGQAPAWIVWLVVGRDVVILAMVAAALAFTQRREFPPTAWGKISTAVQVTAAAALIVHLAFPGAGLDPVAGVLLWVAAAATAWSGVDYVIRGAQIALR
jgi:cardiolipin synthase